MSKIVSSSTDGGGEEQRTMMVELQKIEAVAARAVLDLEHTAKEMGVWEHVRGLIGKEPATPCGVFCESPLAELRSISQGDSEAVVPDSSQTNWEERLGEEKAAKLKTLVENAQAAVAIAVEAAKAMKKLRADAGAAAAEQAATGAGERKSEGEPGGGEQAAAGAGSEASKQSKA